MINLYSVGNENFSSNGDATLQPITATIKKVINGMWQLSMELPYDEDGKYQFLDNGAMLKVSDPSVSEISNTQLWRVYDYKRNTKSVSVIAFPRAMESNFDAPISQLIISSDVTGVSAASSLSAASQKYTVESNITRTGRSEWTNTNLTKAINGTDARSFVNVWGGEVVYDNLTIKILDGIGSDEDVHDVMYGKNINEISYEVDDSGLITRVYPLSTDEIRYNVDGKEYIDSPKIEDYPIIHSGFLTTPYKLIEDDANSITRTANKTADIKSRIRDKASQLSHSIWNTAVANGWKIDYMASIAKDIIANIQTMVTTNIAHADLVKVINSAVNEGMIWMSEQEDPEWVWEQVGTDAWKYGSSVSGRYARNEWQYIDKKWRYFGDDYLWQEPADDDSTWTWYESKTTHKLWYGTQDRYYLKGQYIYYTDPDTGEFTKFWLDGDGWYDADKKDTSDYAWHQDSEVGGAWFFGTVDDDGYRDKYISGQWVFIEGSLYWFDSNGYYYGEKKDTPQYDWIQSGEAWWFGNPDHAYDSIWLKSQWAKIDRQWYRFDADGYAEDIHTQALSMFHSGMGDLTTLVEVCRAECYELLFDLMEEWTNSQFQNGLDVPTVTINVDMIDLSKTVDYADYQNLETIHLGDTVRCVDYVHHIATIERVVELTYDLLRGYNTAVTIGVANSTVGSMLSGSTGGGTASNNAINVDFIEQSLALKQAELVAGRNITLSDNLDGTMTIASDKLIRAGDNVAVRHNSDGSDTISAEGGALEYWVEENTKLYRKEIVSVDNPYGWDCDSDYKWVSHASDGEFAVVAHLRQGYGSSVAGFCLDGVNVIDGQVCLGWAKVLNGYGNRHDYTLIGISGESVGMFHIWGSGNAQTFSFEHNGVTLYYASASTGAEGEELSDMVFEYPTYTIYGQTVNTGMASVPYLGQFESIEDARDALLEQSGFYTQKIRYTGSSIDNETIWAGELHTIGNPQSVTPQQMQFYVTKNGAVEATAYKINGVDLYNIFQKILIAGNNITIGEDGKTISAKDTTYTAGTNVQISGQNVISATDTNAINDMTDVELTDLADGQILKWNATTERWENASGGGGSANISQLTQDEYDALPSTKESDDVLYMVYDDKESPLDPNYRYYKYGENDEIIVRVYHEGESDQEILWFFNGFTKTASDWAIPAELQPYVPSPKVCASKAYSSEDSATQIGWLGWHNGLGTMYLLRSWTTNWSYTLAGTFYAVVDVSQGNEQQNEYYDPYVYIQSTDLTDRMTDYTSESGTASAVGSLNGNFLAWHAFNTEDSFNAYTNGDYWAGNGAGAYLQFDLAEKATITKVAFASYTASSFDLMYSTDGVTYTKAETLTQVDQGTPYPTKQDYELSEELKNVASVRFVCNSACNLGCVHLYGYKGTGETPTRRIYMNGREYTEKVFANPVGEPTDSLSTVEIDGVVYSIKGGGGGGSFESEVIYQNSGSTIPSTIILDKEISNYDAIVLSGYRQQYPNYWTSAMYLSDECAVGRIINIVDDTMYAWYTVTDDTTLTSAGANIVIDKVYGLKFGSGSGGSGSKTALFTNETTTNPATITFDEPITNYDFIMFQTKAGANAVATMTYDTDNLVAGDTIGAGFYTGVFAWYYYTNSQTLTFRVSAGGGYISNITGIKLSS